MKVETDVFEIVDHAADGRPIPGERTGLLSFATRAEDHERYTKEELDRSIVEAARAFASALEFLVTRRGEV